MSLTPTQKAFATSREPFPAFVGGFGSGKTAAAIARAMALKSHFRAQDIAYYLPSFPLVEDIAMRRFPELCERKGWAHKTRGGTSPHIEFPGAGRILFRSMSTPASIVGYEVAHSICDELDTMPAELARQAWNKIIARNRQKCSMPNTVAVATTPEGFGFVHERWVKNKAPGYVLFRAKTMDNEANLPAGYIDNLRNSYPANLLSAYLDGEFVNLTAGSVYPAFDRVLNATFEKIAPAEPLHIGLDFNVTKMAAVVHVLRDGKPYALDELTEVFDTPAMIALIKKRYEGHSILIYPDASGGNRKSHNASESDLSLLRQAGFRVCVNPANPAVKDRVLSMNKIIESRDYRINPDTCPVYVEGLEKQPYDRHGDPDKTGGLDHCFAGDTMVTTPDGIVRIGDLPESGFVMGPFGRYVAYCNAGKKKDLAPTIRVVLSSGHSIQCTPEHQLLTGDGVWTEAQVLMPGQALFLSFPKQGSGTADWIFSAAASTFNAMACACTALFGSTPTGRYRKASTFTTSTTTGRTTHSETSACSASVSTAPSTQKHRQQAQKPDGTPGMARRFSVWLRNGMAPMLGANGTGGTTGKPVPASFTKSGSSAFVSSARLYFFPLMQTGGFVAKAARQTIVGNPGWTTSTEHAPFAGLFLRSTSIRGLPVAARAVLQRLAMMEYRLRKHITASRAARISRGRSALPARYIARTHVESHTVLRIEAAEPEAVYCLATPAHGAFALANGVVVANCLDAGGYFITYKFPIQRRTAIVTPLRM